MHTGHTTIDQRMFAAYCALPDGSWEDGERRTPRLRQRAQAGANTWRAVEGVMVDRRISKRLKGKVTSTCVI